MNKLRNLFIIALFAAAPGCHAQAQQSEQFTTDVCVYGATPAGIMAACAAKSEGKSVVLIEPGRRIGGMTAGGLGWTDLYHPEILKGYARMFYERVAAYYGETGLKLTFEPKVAHRIFQHFLSDNGVSDVLMSHRIIAAEKEDNRIVAITVEDATDTSRQATVRARVFLDCSYEGDLMARAGVSYTIGREANATYGETGNGVQLREKHQFPDGVDPYVVKGDPSSGLLWGISPEPVGAIGSGDRHVQAYNFRLTLTRNAANRIAITDAVPDNYDPARYELLIRLKEKSPWQSYEDCLKWSPMPNDKCDMNNQGAFSTDMIGESYDYPEASYAEREAIYKRHLDYTLGLLYFMWTDERIPANIRQDLAQWGWPRDEYEDNNHITPQLYIRESRRMLGRMVMTQAHCERNTDVEDPIGYADYTMDSHNCGRYVVNGMVKNEGDVQIYLSKGPYPISYRAVTPKEEEACNLIVPVCLSASHIAFGSIRMEPVYMMLGESCGLAACEAIDNYGDCVQQVVAGEVMEHFEERAAAGNTSYREPCQSLLDEYISGQNRPDYQPSPDNTSLPSVSIDLTSRLLVNPDFEWFEQDCQLLPFSGEADQVAAQGLPFGWQQTPKDFSGMTRGIYPADMITNASPEVQKGVYLCNEESFPNGFKLYQAIPASKLIPGTYKVSCLMWVEKDKYGGCCLFANDNVSYWTAEGYYKTNGLTANDKNVHFADYAGGAPTVKHLRPMTVYVTIGEGEDLTFGIRTNSINNGTPTANAGYFIVDHFRLERVVTTPEMMPSEFSAEALINNDFELNPDGTTMPAGNQNTWKLVGRDISEVPGWSQNYTTDNYGITDGKCTNLHGKWSYWLNYKSAPIPNDFRFWQTVRTDMLEPGVYEVACRMWQQQGLLGTGRLFADNGSDVQVMYYGRPENYEGLTEPDEEASFAGYSGSGTEQRNYNEVYVTTSVDEGQHLDIGVFSGYGTTAKAQHGLFHADFFRVWKRSNLPVSYSAESENNPDVSRQRRVTLHKTFHANQWTSLCLPYDLSDADIRLLFGPESRLAEPLAANDEEVHFQTCSHLEAGKPYLLLPSAPLPTPLIIDDVDITVSEPQPCIFQGSPFTLVGTFAPLTIDDTHHTLDNQSAIEAFGAYAEGNQVPDVYIDGIRTEIAFPFDRRTARTTPAYDLSGRYFSHGKVYIQNGEKIIKKQ